MHIIHTPVVKSRRHDSTNCLYAFLPCVNCTYSNSPNCSHECAHHTRVSGTIACGVCACEHENQLQNEHRRIFAHTHTCGSHVYVAHRACMHAHSHAAASASERGPPTKPPRWPKVTFKCYRFGVYSIPAPLKRLHVSWLLISDADVNSYSFGYNYWFENMNSEWQNIQLYNYEIFALKINISVLNPQLN